MCGVSPSYNDRRGIENKPHPVPVARFNRHAAPSNINILVSEYSSASQREVKAPRGYVGEDRSAGRVQQHEELLDN